MPTRSISITPEQDACIDRGAKSGECLKALRNQIKAGVAALEGGEYTEVDGTDLDHHLERLAASPRELTR